jgi:hypothetical protein
MSSYDGPINAARATLEAHENLILAIVRDLAAHGGVLHGDDFRPVMTNYAQSKAVNPLLLESELLFNEVVDNMICTLADLSVVADDVATVDEWGASPSVVRRRFVTAYEGFINRRIPILSYAEFVNLARQK